MKVKRHRPPSLPTTFQITPYARQWFVNYSPLKSEVRERQAHRYSTPYDFILNRAQRRRLYIKLRKQINESTKAVGFPSKGIPDFHLLRLFNIEKRSTALPTPYIYPGWIFKHFNEKPHHIISTPRPTADQIIFLLSIPYKEWHNYLNLNTCELYHPDVLYSRKLSW